MEHKPEQVLKDGVKLIRFKTAAKIRNVQNGSLVYAMQQGYVDYVVLDGRYFVIANTPKSNKYLETGKQDSPLKA